MSLISSSSSTFCSLQLLLLCSCTACLYAVCPAAVCAALVAACSSSSGCGVRSCLIFTAAAAATVIVSFHYVGCLQESRLLRPQLSKRSFLQKQRGLTIEN
jgi:hypothetical protein